MNASATACRALVRKDVLTFVRDRRALLVSILLPIVIAAFFGSLFGGSGEAPVSRLAVAVVDHDGSALSQALVADLEHDHALALEPLDLAAARARIGAGKLRAAIVLPAGFGAQATGALFGGGTQPSVELLYDPSQSLARPIVAGLLTEHAMQQVTRELMSGTGSVEYTDRALASVAADARLAPAMRADLTTMLGALRHFQEHTAAAPAEQRLNAGGLRVPFTIADVAVSGGPRYSSYSHSFAGMSVQFILFMGIDAGVALLLMRQQGVWRRLRAAPLAPAVLLASRVLGTALIALLIMAAVYAVGCLVFGVRIAGSVVGFAAIAVAFALLAASTGLMVAALGRSVAATRGLSTFVALVLVMLGGAWVPTFIFPDWLQRAALFVPTRWAVDGLDAMTWRAQPLSAALAPVAVLLGFAALFALVAVWRFDWEAD